MSDGASLLSNLLFLPLWALLFGWWRWLWSRLKSAVHHNFALVSNVYRETHYREALGPLLTCFWEERRALHSKAIERNLIPDWAGTYPDRQLIAQHFDRVNETVDLLGGSVDSFIKRPLVRVTSQLEALERVCSDVRRLQFWAPLGRQLHFVVLAFMVVSLVTAVVGVIALTLAASDSVPVWLVSSFIAVPYACAWVLLSRLACQRSACIQPKN